MGRIRPEDSGTRAGTGDCAAGGTRPRAEDPNRAPAGRALMPVVPDVSGEDREKCDVCGGSGDCRDCKGTGNGGQCFNCAGTGNCPQCQGTGLRKKKAG